LSNLIKTEYNWKEAYTLVVDALVNGDVDVTKQLQSDIGRIAVSKFLDDKAYGETSANQLATMFFDLSGGVTYRCFLNIDPEKVEKLMLRLMEIKLAIGIVFDYDSACEAFTDWQEGAHDT
jgi:hypothetical protein